jgi:hypothetical protein
MDDDKNLEKSTSPPMRPLVVSIASLIVFLVALGIMKEYA